MSGLTPTQLKLIADFLSNMAVVWFAAAFIAPTNFLLTIISSIEGLIALVLAIWIMHIKEVQYL